MSVEVYPVKIIGHIRTDFTSKFGVPRQSGIVDALEARIEFEKEFAQICPTGSLPGTGGLLPFMDHLAVFGSGTQQLVCHSATAPAGGQYKSGCVCHPFAVSSQRHRAFFGKN